ncbi:MAG: hypothetical protein ACT4P8_08780 [Betaproteobacteria bacterium]
MTAALAPSNGNRYLLPAEVIRRVKAAFAYIETSEKSGAAH